MPDLHGKRVLVTRPPHQAEYFAQALREAGAEPICFPVITIGPPPDLPALDRVLQGLTAYDWLILTSVNGVAAVWERLAYLAITSLPEGLKVAAIGPQTASALQEQGLDPDFVPGEYIAEAILPGLGEMTGRRFLLLRADQARRALADQIRLQGGLVDEVTAYQTLPAQPSEESIAGLRAGIDWVTFTSSSTVRNFVAAVRSAGLDPLDLPGSPRFACIGPVTAQTAHQEGLPVDVIASEYTTRGLLDAMVASETAPSQGAGLLR